MEVVVLLVAMVGVALLAIPRLQRRKAVKPRKRVSTPVVAAVAVPASSAAAWAPPEGPEWEDDLGWEGEAEPAPEALEAWEDWRATALPSADPQAPAPEAELPSVERWRVRASEDDDWVEDDDDGLGWEGEDEPPPAPGLWNGNGHAPAPNGYDAGSTDFNGGRDWSRSSEPAPAQESASAFATASATDVAAPAPAAPISDPEPGRSIEPDADEWDPPLTRTWGAAATRQAAAAPKPATRRSGSRVHPVLLVALYAAVGIGVVVLASTALLGGSADPKPAAKKQPVVTAATATATPVATATPQATPTPDPAIAAAAQSDFTRERSNAVRRHKAVLADAVAAAKREAKAKKKARDARRNDNKKPAAPSGNSGGGTNYTPPVATYTPPRSNPAPAAQKPKKRSVCEFCIG